MRLLRVFFILAVICAYKLGAYQYAERLALIAQETKNPMDRMAQLDRLVVMGNSPLSEAEIILLPEIHDDPKSLHTQFLILAQEKKKHNNFLVLDESLSSMKKSMWDLFSQKAMEIMAAQDQKRAGSSYSPRGFEAALQRLATGFGKMPGKMVRVNSLGIWAFDNFLAAATPFYGWDRADSQSLSERNLQMVESLKSALQQSQESQKKRIFVMLGARHVPELEFLSSRQLVCDGNRFANMDDYFAAIIKYFGVNPNLDFGVGATASVYRFLQRQKYAVVFNKSLLNELDTVLNRVINQRLGYNCIPLQ